MRGIKRFSGLLIAAIIALPLIAAVPTLGQQPAVPTTTTIPAAPPPAAAQPVATQNTITTTAPVTSTTEISIGTYAGQALIWVASVFGTTIGGALTLLIMKLLKNAGIAGGDLMRARLQEIIVNGLNLGAKASSDALKGKGQIEVKNVIVARAVVYAQDHGAEALKAVGLDPTSPEAIEAIKARIETAIADPSVPTPAVLDPAKVPTQGTQPPLPTQPPSRLDGMPQARGA